MTSSFFCLLVNSIEVRPCLSGTSLFLDESPKISLIGSTEWQLANTPEHKLYCYSNLS